MNWNTFIEIKNKEIAEKNGLICVVCGSYAEKVRCYRCDSPYKIFHFLCSNCFCKMTSEFHDKYVKYRKNTSSLKAKKEEKKEIETKQEILL